MAIRNYPNYPSCWGCKERPSQAN